MFDILDKTYEPDLYEIEEYIHNENFMKLITTLENKYDAKISMSYSYCSWKMGWNVKVKKGSKSLCTIYPECEMFTVLVVIGKNETEKMEELLPSCSNLLQTIYHETEVGNNQRWLMIPVEDKEQVDDVLKCISTRTARKKKCN